MQRPWLHAALAIVGLCGCSFLAVRGPQSSRVEGEEPSCHTSHGAVVADGLLAIASLGIAAASDDGAGQVSTGLVGVLAGSSMLYGLSRNARCQRELTAYEAELAAEERAARRQGAWAGAADAATTKPPAPATSRPPAAPVVSSSPPPVAAAVVRKPDVTRVSGAPDEDDGEDAGEDAGDDAAEASAEPDEAPGAAERAFHVADDGSRPSPPPADDDSDDDSADDDSATPPDPEERWHAFWRRLK